MACNTCKKTRTNEKTVKPENTESRINILVKIRDYTIKIFAFLFLSAIFIPLVIPATFYALFVTVFMEKGINIVPLGLYIGKKLFKKEDDNDEDDDDGDDDLEDSDYDELLTEDEYELEDSDDITLIK